MTAEIQEECKMNMDGSLEHMHHSFKSLRTGKVMTSILDGIKLQSLVFNGEIYNYLELKDEHLSDYPFYTESDTEVIVALYDKYGIEKKSYNLTVAGCYKYWDVTDDDVGLNFLVIQRDDGKGLAVQPVTIERELIVKGYTYNAENESVLPEVLVNISQAYEKRENTSTADGYYYINNLSVNFLSTLNASKTNYIHNDFSFIPFESKVYDINLFLLPDVNNIQHNGTAIGGLVQSFPYYQNISNATVKISNETWNTSTNTNSMGYYMFDNLSYDEYTLSATALSYHESDEEKVQTINDTFVYQHFLLTRLYNISVYAKDGNTLETIYNFTTYLGTESNTTTTGVSDFSDFEYGYYVLSVESPGYYTYSDYLLVDDDKNLTVYLLSSPPPPEYNATTPGLVPHIVELRFRNFYGTPVTDVEVTATPVETSGVWGWLKSIFGYTENIGITNTTLKGITDTNGAISFPMVEVMKYKVNYKKGDIDKTFTLYPKEDQYDVFLPYSTPDLVTEGVSLNISVHTINSTHSNITFSYSDTTNKTTRVYLFADIESENYGNQTFLSTSNIIYNITVRSNDEYISGIVAEKSDFEGEDIVLTKVIKFKELLIDLGIKDEYYTWISVLCIFFLSGLFSTAISKYGYIIVPCSIGCFYYIGWLDVSKTLVIIVIVLGVLLYYSKREREVM